MKEPLGKYIARIYTYQQIILNKYLEPYGIGSGQYLFMLMIMENEGISQKELSKLLNIDKSTTAKALIKLEEGGYIHRVVNNNDKRYNELYLTEKGLEFIPTLKKILVEVTQSLITGINEEQYTETLKTLKIILGNAQSSVGVLRQEKCECTIAFKK